MEQRKEQRADLTHDIVLDDDLHARNLSESGIQIQSSRALTVGRELRVQLDLGDERISVIGEVRWSSVHLAEASGQYVSGLVFRNQNSSDILAIRRYLATLEDESAD